MQDPTHKIGKGSKACQKAELTVVDDLPMVPLVTDRELDALECFLGDVIAALLGHVGSNSGNSALAPFPDLPRAEDAA